MHFNLVTALTTFVSPEVLETQFISPLLRISFSTILSSLRSHAPCYDFNNTLSSFGGQLHHSRAVAYCFDGFKPIFCTNTFFYCYTYAVYSAKPYMVVGNILVHFGVVVECACRNSPSVLVPSP